MESKIDDLSWWVRKYHKDLNELSYSDIGLLQMILELKIENEELKKRVEKLEYMKHTHSRPCNVITQISGD